LVFRALKLEFLRNFGSRYGGTINLRHSSNYNNEIKKKIFVTLLLFLSNLRLTLKTHPL